MGKQQGEAEIKIHWETITFVTSERVKNLVGLYGKILRKSEVANAQYQKYL